MPGTLSAQDLRILQDALSTSPRFADVATRQTLIHEAFDGCSHSAQIQKSLGWLDWQGPPVVVAHQLLELLNGCECDPGEPALKPLAEAIERVAGGSHRELVAELRVRLGWALAWRDQRPAGMVEEKIVGENTLKPLYHLRRALVAADAVVRIEVNGRFEGTGFLVAPDLMMTAFHVICNRKQPDRLMDRAGHTKVTFFDEAADPRGQPAPPRQSVSAGPAPFPVAHGNPDLDYVAIRLNGAPAPVHVLPLRPVVMEQNARVAIIQHPRGQPKQISFQNNLVTYADEEIVQYRTSTLDGSSGSPVLDDSFAVVAIHQLGGHHRNQGISMVAVVQDLRANKQGLLQKLTIL